MREHASTPEHYTVRGDLRRGAFLGFFAEPGVLPLALAVTSLGVRTTELCLIRAPLDLRLILATLALASWLAAMASAEGLLDDDGGLGQNFGAEHIDSEGMNTLGTRGKAMLLWHYAVQKQMCFAEVVALMLTSEECDAQ